MIIADISSNWSGSILAAKRLIREAKDNGSDIAKFQLYQTKHLNRDVKTLSKLKDMEIDFNTAKILFDYGKEIGFDVFFSVFFPEAVEWCEKIGVKLYKLAARQSTCDDTAKLVKQTHKRVIVSIDPMHNREEGWSEDFYDVDTLYCPSHYPTRIESVRFSDYDFMHYDGFSDHTIRIDACKVAMARGARIIEKHFAFDHITGLDAKWSMTPSQLKELSIWQDKVNKLM
jgi:pseudaminic acid synthase